jgi:hypothetical protein
LVVSSLLGYDWEVDPAAAPSGDAARIRGGSPMFHVSLSLRSGLVLATLILAPAYLLAPAAPAGNDDTTLVLHVHDHNAWNCFIGIDCVQNMPVVNAQGMMSPEVFLFVRNYDEVAGVQCAFTVPTSWTFLFGLWDCQTNQINGTTPEPPFGAVSGTIATAFDALTSGELEPIGRMNFQSGPVPEGCMTIVDSAYPNGTHVVTWLGDPTPVPPENRAIVCVGEGGRDACEPAAVPVPGTTWGRIKQQLCR